jgi:sulfur carrier protein
VNVTVNGEAVEIDEHMTVARLLETRGFPEKGIAVKVEVVTAVQGG